MAMVVAGNSVLRVMETSLHYLDLIWWQACCLPGACQDFSIPFCGWQSWEWPGAGLKAQGAEDLGDPRQGPHEVPVRPPCYRDKFEV